MSDGSSWKNFKKEMILKKISRQKKAWKNTQEAEFTSECDILFYSAGQGLKSIVWQIQSEQFEYSIWSSEKFEESSV